MNKAVISGVCGFVLGAGVGTGATAFYYHRQIKSIKQQIQDFQAELDLLYSQMESPVVINPTPERDQESINAGERAKANWAGKMDYHKKYQTSTESEESSEEVDASGEAPPVEETEDDEDEEGPHNMHPLDSHEDDVIYQTQDMRVGVRCWVIDEDEVGDFMMDNEGWDEETLLYYAGCGTLEDAGICTILHDDGYYVGDCLETSGFADNPNEKVVYIANDSLATLYRVEKLEGTYASWNGED